MMQDVNVKSYPGLPWQRSIQQEEGFFFFHQQSGLKFKQKLGKCYTWSIALYCAELGHLDSSSEIPVKFCNTVLEKAREGHWTDRVKNGKLFQSQE